MKVGITKMYADIAKIIGIENYDVVNPYNNKLTEYYDLLIISKGYKERVKKLNPYPIFEIKSATFDDLIDSLNGLKRLNIGAPNKIDKYIETIQKKKNEIKSLKYPKNVKINSKTEFIKKIIADLGLNISDDGILIIPDYMVDKNITITTIDENGKKTYIMLNTHRYDLNTLERIEDRYLSIIKSINKLSVE
ncbi:hypothetical protein [Methanothermococcus okinawensis]|uniref:Segregation and condensation protein B n=1 Tax=Methanothermococcus okinawensis (strain DSM 14208 / JCM 11175 / IH1) TaxID=647113 RepID=F8ALF1_METOI|nr:hypothetical protein [Methanothermococcus okinawensis]AEH06540.1 putative segregation and condensation protein B [Methanothermococcus okinawensis IH1]